jgi:hypothetical protein
MHQQSWRMIAARAVPGLGMAAPLGLQAGWVGAAEEGAVPAEQAVLKVQAPAGATVSLDDEGQGEKRTFAFAGLRPGQYATHEVRVRFKDGERAEPRVLLPGGRAFESHKVPVKCAAFRPEGKELVTGSEDKTAIFHEVDTGARLHTFGGVQQIRPTNLFLDALFASHTRVVRAVAFSPDGKRLLTVSRDRTAILWDAIRGGKLRTLPEQQKTLSEAAFAPDGKHVLTGDCDGRIVLWDADSGRKVREVMSPGNEITALGYSPDGKRVLATAWRDAAAFWDAESGAKIPLIPIRNAGPRAVAFGPDGRRILTGSFDGTIHLWDVATGQELAAPIDFDEGREWLVVTPAGLFDGSVGGRQRVSYRIGRGLNVVPVDRSFQDFYRPGLLAAVLSGERPEPVVEIGRAAPPRLRIVAPGEGGDVETTRLTLEVEAIDQGGGVRRPTPFHNGSRVLAREPASARDTSVRHRFDVSLVEGRNVLEVRAASRDGSQDSDPVQISLRYARPLARPDLHLLAVGVSRYADQAFTLKFAAADARGLADLFLRRGRALYAGVHAVTLLDDKAGRAATRKEAARRGPLISCHRVGVPPGACEPFPRVGPDTCFARYFGVQ